MSGNDTLLRALVADAFGEPEVKTASARPAPQTKPVPGKTKIATGLTSTQFVKKLAAAVDFIAGGLEKQAIGGPEGGLLFGQGSGVDAAPFDTESDILGGDQAVREMAIDDGTDISGAVSGMGAGFFPGTSPGFTGPSSTPLAAAQSDTDEALPGGFAEQGGIDYDALMQAVGGGHGTSKVASPKLRAKMAMDRVLGKAKAAAIKRAQETVGADASVPPPGTTGEPLAPESGTEESSSFTPDAPTLASEVPQSTDTVMAVTNQDADEANRAALENALGTTLVANADADTTREEVFEGASGDGDSGPAEKEALASILNTSVLTRIAQGG